MTTVEIRKSPTKERKELEKAAKTSKKMKSLEKVHLKDKVKVKKHKKENKKKKHKKEEKKEKKEEKEKKHKKEEKDKKHKKEKKDKKHKKAEKKRVSQEKAVSDAEQLQEAFAETTAETAVEADIAIEPETAQTQTRMQTQTQTQTQTLLPDSIPEPNDPSDEASQAEYAASVIKAWTVFRPALQTAKPPIAARQIITYARALVNKTRLQRYTISREELGEIFGSRFLPERELDRIAAETGLRPIRGRTSAEERAQLWRCIREYCEEFGATEEQVRSWFFLQDRRNRSPTQRRSIRQFIMSVSRKFGGRTCKAIYLMYRRLLNPWHRLGQWPLEADQQLVALHARHGNNWDEIGRHLGRSGLSCRDRFRVLEDMFARTNDGSWARDELERLESAVREYCDAVEGTERDFCVSWLYVAERVQTRTPSQCLQKWIRIIDQHLLLTTSKRGRSASAADAADPQSWTDADRLLLCRALLEGGWTCDEAVCWQTVADFCSAPPQHSAQKHRLPNGGLSRPRTASELRRQWQQLRLYAPKGCSFDEALFHVTGTLRFQHTVVRSLSAVNSTLQRPQYAQRAARNAGARLGARVTRFILDGFQEEMSAAAAAGTDGSVGAAVQFVVEMGGEGEGEGERRVSLKAATPVRTVRSIKSTLSKEFISDSDTDAEGIENERERESGNDDFTDDDCNDEKSPL